MGLDEAPSRAVSVRYNSATLCFRRVTAAAIIAPPSTEAPLLNVSLVAGCITRLVPRHPASCILYQLKEYFFVEFTC